MMNNSSSTKDRQALEEANEKNSNVTDDESIVNEEIKAVETLSVDAVHAMDEIATKQSENHGEIVKLMQDMRESRKDRDVKKAGVMEDSMIDSDHSISLTRKKTNNVGLLNSENLHKRIFHYTGLRPISQFIKFKSHKLNSTSVIFGTPRTSQSAWSEAEHRRRRLRKGPIPTKQWAYIYHRRLVRQNAFCGSWPAC